MGSGKWGQTFPKKRRHGEMTASLMKKLFLSEFDYIDRQKDCSDSTIHPMVE